MPHEHHRNTISPEINDDRCHAIRGESSDDVLDLTDDLEVERRGKLIEQHDFRANHPGTARTPPAAIAPESLRGWISALLPSPLEDLPRLGDSSYDLAERQSVQSDTAQGCAALRACPLFSRSGQGMCSSPSQTRRTQIAKIQGPRGGDRRSRRVWTLVATSDSHEEGVDTGLAAYRVQEVSHCI